MEQTVLTPHQQTAIQLIAQEPNLADFYLTGGTALAGHYFQHRLSDDLDWFTSEPIDSIWLQGFIQRLKTVLGGEEVRFERLHDRHQFFFKFPEGELKVEFTRYPFSQLEPSVVKDGVKVDSLTDIAANKLMALLDRFDPKDFVDLYFILQSIALNQIQVNAEKKFGLKISNLLLGGELAKVRRVEALPKMLKPLTIEELKTFFTERAKKLSSAILF